MVSEQNFLKILPQAVDDFMDYLKMVVSINLLNGAHFATIIDGTPYGGVANPTVGGLASVDRPDRFAIGQKVVFVDGNTPLPGVTGFVSTINMNTQTVSFVTARGGATPVDLTGITVAQGGKTYHDGASDTTSFSSLRGALLSAANGGDAALYGQTKTAYPYLQAINVDGSDITATNLLEKIFNAMTRIRQLGKGNPTDVVMSYKHLGTAMQIVESGSGIGKGPFNVTPGSQKASIYGWTEIEIGSVTKGGLKLVGVQEMDDDIIIFLDWRALKFHSNGFFQKRKSPDGKEYFEVRATTGYQYIIDICLFGELVVIRPSYCGILYGIDY